MSSTQPPTPPATAHSHNAQGRLRWWRGTLAVLTLATATASAIAAPTATAAAHATPTTTPTRPLSVGQALIRAHNTRAAVTVEAATTETDTLRANPDGTLTLTRTALPVRTLINHAWTGLDATLRRNPDGSVSPAVATSPLRLSGGGTGPFAVLHTANGGWLSLSLPMTLPTPTLSGATATYTGVLPGVDLKLSADTQGGLRQVLVVHDAAGAANPQLRALTLATATSPGLSMHTDAAGNLQATDTTGRTQFSAPAPLLWDSTPATPATTVTDSTGTRRDARTGLPATSSPAGPGEAAHTSHLHVTTSTGHLTLTPDQTVLSDPATHYPVFIDPGWSNNKSAWASVSKYYPSTNYWNNTPDPDPNTAQVGNAGTMWSHTLVNFPLPISTLTGASISDATFTITETNSASCTASTVNVYAPTTTLSSSNATWTYWAGANVGGVVASRSVAYGWSSHCPAASVGFNVTPAIRSAVSAGRSTQTLLMAGDNESDTNSWKEFYIPSASLAVTYNHPPATPTGLRTSPVTSCTATTPTTVGDAEVDLYAQVSDPDADKLNATFQVLKTSTSASIASGTVSYPSGTTARFAITKDTLDNATLDPTGHKAVTEFSWSVVVSDGSATSATSTTCTFNFDPTRTGQPGVLPPTQVTIGQPASVSITPPPNGTTTPASYLYQLNGAAPTQLPATNGYANFNITPTRTTSTLTVTSLSAGGNIGDTATAIINADPPATAQADQDLSGDNIPDLHTVGGANGLPAGLWLNPGRQNSTAGSVEPNGADIGANGVAYVGDNNPADYTTSQLITGYFTGGSLQDILVYYPHDVTVNNILIAAAGSGIVINGTGDGSALQTDTGDTHTIRPSDLADNGDTPLQLVNAGNSAAQDMAFPDLIAVNGHTGAYHLDYYTSNNRPGSYRLRDPLSTPTPAGDLAWNNWTITSCQISTANGSTTSLLLWNSTTGALYLWTNLTHTLGTPDLGYTQYTLAANGWNTGAALSLQAADINTDGTADLWSIGPNAHATAYLITANATTGTATITTQPTQALITTTHSWKLDDATSGSVGTAQDTAGTLNATGTTGAAWNTGDLFTPDVVLDGTGALATTAPAITATDADFTISAWVKPTTTGGTVLSQDGTSNAAFRLWAEPSDASWRFAIATSTQASPAYDTAAAPPGSVQPMTWTHLTATYQRSTGQITLYIDTLRAAATTHLNHPAISGDFHIGDTQTAGSHSDRFTGQISQVQTANQVITPGTLWYDLAAQYNLDEPAGSTTLADSSGNGHPLTATSTTLGEPGLIAAGPTAAKFTGASPSMAATAATDPVIDTTKSFTVAAWARLDDTTNFATIVEQKGANTSPFDLQYVPATKDWAFTVMSPDATAPTQTRIFSTNPAQTGKWTHLTGVYDAAAGQIQLYIDGILNSSAATTVTWTSTGSLVIGSDWWTKTATSWFKGAISDVQIFHTALNPATIAALSAPTEVGHWPLSDGAGTTAADTSGYHHPAQLSTGATWTTGHNSTGTAMQLNGTTGAATTTTAPVLNTDQSLTVSAWVRLDKLGQWATVVIQQGANTSPFDLQYDPTNNKWAFTVMSPDVTVPTQNRIWSTSAAQTGTWTHLVGVYDAIGNQIRLYVNGTLNATTTATPMWNTTGPLVIGRDWWTATATSWWPGAIQDVHVYAGAMTDNQAATLYQTS